MIRQTTRTALAVCSLLLLSCIASAQDGARVLGQQSFEHELLGRTARTNFSFSLDETGGGRAQLNIDLQSALPPGSSGRAVLLNTLVGLACSPGVRMSAQPRPYWLNPLSGEYEFIYSRDLPDLSALEGLDTDMQQAVSGGPEQMFAALSRLSRALDPEVQPSGPQSALLSGADPQYMIGGVSWLMPVTMHFDELARIYSEEPGLSASPQIRVSVPLEISASVNDPHIVVYVGGLSSAMQRSELLPQDLPATAIPLAPLPEAAVAAEPAAAEEAGAAGGAEGSEPAAEGAAETVAVQPEPVPALVYSYKWVSWEGRLDLAAGSGATIQPSDVEAPADSLLKPFESEPETDAAPAPASEQDSSSSAIDFFIPGGASESVAVESADSSESSPEQPSATEVTATETEPNETETTFAGSQEEGESIEVGESSESIAKAVEPGTIPDFEGEFVIPLKPITNPAPQGGSGLRQPISSGSLGGAPTYSAPPDLGEMILVPEGYFLLGTGQSAQDSEEDERPQQQLFLPDFYIDKYLVTNRQFYEFVLAGGYKPDGQWERYFSPATADLPVRGVSYKDASAYARWAGKRLPTEAEWEKAMRGTDGRTYPWGEEWSASILPRGEFNYDVVMAADAASPYGLLSTVGVLWQWTSSSFAPYPYDPKVNNQYKVLRGGCFSNGRNVVRCANRYSEGETVALNTFGFRCAKDA